MGLLPTIPEFVKAYEPDVMTPLNFVACEKPYGQSKVTVTLGVVVAGSIGIRGAAPSKAAAIPVPVSSSTPACFDVSTETVNVASLYTSTDVGVK